VSGSDPLQEREWWRRLFWSGMGKLNRIECFRGCAPDGVLGLGNDRFRRLKQDTCAINVFEVDDDGFTLVTMNDTGHLRFRQA